MNSSAPSGRGQFVRGPDRRRADLPVVVERRSGPRRTLGSTWIPLFKDVDEPLVLQELRDCEVLDVAAGTALLKPGDVNHNVYVLLSGLLAAHLDTNLDLDQAIQIPQGGCIGELSVIDGKPVSALVLAHTDVRVLVVSDQLFWYRLMVLPGVARNLLVSLTERMRRTNQITLEAQREHLELVHLRKELDFARQLQTSMLPLQRPLFPERLDLDICGLMEPASKVGGDFFDAFFVDDDHLFFVIGDVSGHGVAAALFMARAVGLLRILAMNTLGPDTLLTTLNQRLSVGNDTNLFVTIFCGFLNVNSGRLVYSNGGHCAPILLTQSGARELAIPKGSLVGAFEGARYSALEITLAADETLFCYTDGVTEAHNPLGEEYGEARCLTLLAESANQRLLEMPALLDAVRVSVERFSGSAVLEDDCTMLALRRKPR
jgi:phosphoserine phosphatase RsbU/P